MIQKKLKEEIKILRAGGKILASILDTLIKEVKPGKTTGELEDMAIKLISEARGEPSFKGHVMHDSRIFPTALCVSINSEIVHAPSLPSRELKSGDIVSIDLGMKYPVGKGEKSYFTPQKKDFSSVNRGQNFAGFTDISKTLGVGEISEQASKLIKVTKESLELAIKQVRPGNALDNIGATIQKFVEANGFSVVRELVGHGVGYDVHEEPQVPNFVDAGKSKEKVILEEGIVIAIEPMVNVGGWKVKTGADGFTVVTEDNSLSAHFEHSVAVVEGGCEVLTRS